MLLPWFWNSQGWKVRVKKQAYWNLVASPVFKNASVVHAITPLERDALHRFFPSQRIEVISNAIDLADLDAQIPSLDSSPEPIILFLGRIHPQKGIDILLRAFVEAKLPAKWRLVIAGPSGSPAYEEELHRLVQQSGTEGRVEFIGPIFGEAKWKWIKRAWVVAVPSNTEVVGIVNLEAAACGTPTITTFETGLTRWGESGGLLIHPDVHELADSLRQVSAWTDSERISRGEVSRRFIEQFFSWDVILPQWLDLYESVLDKG
jgi:glycosyltransferase involved in cell wall biosynthesis